jgi:hypothetical protein
MEEEAMNAFGKQGASIEEIVNTKVRHTSEVSPPAESDSSGMFLALLGIAAVGGVVYWATRGPKRNPAGFRRRKA